MPRKRIGIGKAPSLEPGLAKRIEREVANVFVIFDVEDECGGLPCRHACSLRGIIYTAILPQRAHATEHSPEPRDPDEVAMSCGRTGRSGSISMTSFIMSETSGSQMSVITTLKQVCALAICRAMISTPSPAGGMAATIVAKGPVSPTKSRAKPDRLKMQCARATRLAPAIGQWRQEAP